MPKYIKGDKMEIKGERQPAILQKMKMMYNSLSKAEQKVVSYVTANPKEVIHLSVAGVAENSGVSDATVIRACRSLGLKRYQDLRLCLVQDIVTPIQSIHEEVMPDDSISTIIDRTFKSTIHTMNLTHDILRPEVIEQAADSIIEAKHIVVFGHGNSMTIANDLQHKLLRLGILVQSYPDSHMTAIAISGMGSGDVFFAISHSGSSTEVVDLAKLARERGAKVITLSDINRSPLQKYSDIALHTASEETKYRVVALSSRVAQMTLIITLYTIIAMKKPDSVDSFRRVEKALGVKKY